MRKAPRCTQPRAYTRAAVYMDVSARMPAHSLSRRRGGSSGAGSRGKCELRSSAVEGTVCETSHS
eukprot:7756492-Pyramimonas_sp.AAC.1